MFSGIHMSAISQEMLMNLFHKMCLEIALLELPPHFPGANELNCDSMASFSISHDVHKVLFCHFYLFIYLLYSTVILSVFGGYVWIIYPYSSWAPFTNIDKI